MNWEKTSSIATIAATAITTAATVVIAVVIAAAVTVTRLVVDGGVVVIVVVVVDVYWVKGVGSGSVTTAMGVGGCVGSDGRA